VAALSSRSAAGWRWRLTRACSAAMHSSELFDGVKSADSIVRQSAAHALGQYESNILVSGFFLGLSYNDIFVKRKSISVNGYYCNEEAEKKPRNYKNDQNEEIRNLAKIELEKWRVCDH
jgi:hypothetical protein